MGLGLRVIGFSFMFAEDFVCGFTFLSYVEMCGGVGAPGDSQCSIVPVLTVYSMSKVSGLKFWGSLKR